MGASRFIMHASVPRREGRGGEIKGKRKHQQGHEREREKDCELAKLRHSPPLST